MNRYDKSDEIIKKGKRYLFEVTRFAEPVIVRGEGSIVWDADGNKYYDLNAGQFCMSFGHAYKPFIECVYKQLQKIYHTNTSTLSPEVFIAAEKMASITDYQLTKTLFLSTGSEANEAALRYAKFITGKEGVLGFDFGYHGLTLAAQGVTMGGKWSRPFVPQNISVKTPDYMHSNSECDEQTFIDECILDLEEKFAIYGNSLAAVLLEPVIGVGGMISISKKYLMRVRELCDEYNVILIFDECQCGFARSGKWFAYQKVEVIPDILVTAKSMGMGFAVSAITLKENLAICAEGKLVHFSSHQNDPLSAAVVSFVIDTIKNNNLLKRNERMGEYLLSQLKEACDITYTLCNARGNGLMVAFDINESIVSNYHDYSLRFIKNMERNGVLIQAIRQGRTFRIMPNYFVKEEEIIDLKKAIIQSVKEI